MNYRTFVGESYSCMVDAATEAEEKANTFFHEGRNRAYVVLHEETLQTVVHMPVASDSNYCLHIFTIVVRLGKGAPRSRRRKQ